MYLTAHRVVSPKGREGINAFLFTHGTIEWPSDLLRLIEENPGELVRQAIEVPPPDNRVRSYLDAVVPDDTPRETIQMCLEQLVLAFRPREFPARMFVDPCWIAASMEVGLAATWEDELRSLTRHLLFP